MAVKHKYAHTLHAVSFTVLALSGLSLMLKGKSVFELPFGGKKGAATVHKYVAWLYLTTNAYLSLKILPEVGVRGSLTLKALYQRLFYWFVFLSLSIMVPTGLILTFKGVGRELLLFTASVHKTFALILIATTLTHALIRFHKPAILFSQLKELCRQCAEKPCLGACPTEAIRLTPTGAVEFNDVRCIACNRCVEVCPKKVVYYAQGGKPLFVKPA